MSHFSLFNNSPNNTLKIDANYISPQDWLLEGCMNALLLELSKEYPETRPLYNLYLIKKIGWINNKLNKHDIIHKYLKIINFNYIKQIIDNFEIEGQIIKNNLDIRACKDKTIILFILNKYLINTTSTFVYHKLINIIQYINTINYIDSYELAKLLRTQLIMSVHPSIVIDIINYRKINKF